MIVITAKFPVLPEYADQWPTLAKEFTEATRTEPGCLWFEWSRSVDDPTVYVIVEAFADTEAGAAHVNAAHFKAAQATLPTYLAATPQIIHVNDESLTGWTELGEFAVPTD